MDQIIITKPDDSTWALFSRSAVSSVTRAEQKRSLLGEDIITMTVESATTLPFGIGDKITIFGSTYILNALPTFLKGGKRKFTYNIIWEGRQYDLLRSLFLDEDDDGFSISSDQPITGSFEFLMNILINNLERVFGTGSWILGVCPETDPLTYTPNGQNCLAVLQELCSEKYFNKEFEITEEEDVCTIDIKDAIGQSLPFTFEYGKANGLYNLTREMVSDKNIITRLYAFGANKNLASDYRGFSQRLKLPSNDMSYIEDDPAKTAYGHIEGIKNFDEIFPHRTGTVTSLGSTVYQFIDTGMDFDLNAVDEGGNTLYLINGTSAKIHFNTGNLAGYEFEILSYNHPTKTFTLKAFKDERGQAFPDPDLAAFQFSIGDSYVITDIMMPASYITTAENALLAAAQAYLTQNCQPRVQYANTLDEIYLIKLYPGPTIVNVFNIGDSLHIKDTDIGVDKLIRIKTLMRDLFRYYKYTFSLSDFTDPSILQRLVATAIETEKIIAINKLNDVARAKRSWKSTREVLDMIFDTDNYFDGANIRPDSIETMMISVGARSQQFSISTIIEPNFEGDEDVVNINAGTLSHYAIEDEIRDWAISGGEINLTDPDAYYIYAKCEKTGSAGTIIFSQNQIKVDDDASYYHFLLGIIHSVDTETGTRWISLTYGATSISGSHIKTGLIISADGYTWFDLDGSEIKVNKGMVGGWNIDSDAIYTGTKKTDPGYTVDGITMASNGSLRSKFFEIRSDGKAKFESVDSIFKSATVGAGNLSGSVVNVQPNIPLSDQWYNDVWYYPNDKCSHNGINYIAVVANINDEPPSSSWITDPVQPQARIDKITLSGTSGEANILCDALTKKAYFNESLPLTAEDFVDAYAANWLSEGVILTSVDDELFFESSTPGIDFTGNTTITNVPVTDIGSIKIQGNNIWENDTDADNGAVQINLKGFGGGITKYRSLRIGDGKGNIIARFYGTPTGPVILFPLLKTSISGCVNGEVYRDGAGSGAILKIK